MKQDLLKAVRISLLFISCALMISFAVFFMLFGKGLQIFLPIILFSVFFMLFFILERIPFISSRPVLKSLLAVLLVIIMAFLL